jgi:hypothetical protein
MIDVSWSSFRILMIMILGSIWFFLLVSEIEERSEK